MAEKLTHPAVLVQANSADRSEILGHTPSRHDGLLRKGTPGSERLRYAEIEPD